jgi:hypothetical protein
MESRSESLARSDTSRGIQEMSHPETHRANRVTKEGLIIESYGAPQNMGSTIGFCR